MPSIPLALLLLAAANLDPAPDRDGERSLDPLVNVTVLERDLLVERVLERNPSVLAARRAVAAAEAVPAQVSALPDPMLGYSIAPLSIGSSNVHFGQRLVGEQMLPYPGKRRLRGAAAAAEAAAIAEDLAVLRLDLGLRAAQMFDDWYLVHRALEINEAHRLLVADILTVATGRYAAGLVPQQDPLEAEVELAHVEHERVMLEANRDRIAARLAALLHRPPDLPVPPPPQSLPRPAVGGSHGGSMGDELVAVALASRAELRRLQAEIRAAESRVELARLERRPDLSVMGSYDSMWGETEHQWMAGVGVSLPLGRRRIAAGEAEAEARLEAMRFRRDAMVDEITAEVAIAALQVREAAHVLELYQSRLLPASRDRLQAARSGFETSQSGFSMLIEAERNLRNVELGFEQALTDHHRRLAELDRSVGWLPLTDRDGDGLPVSDHHQGDLR